MTQQSEKKCDILVPCEIQSNLEWKGLKSSKFEKGRVHLRQVDQLDRLQASALPVLGRKHFKQNLSDQYQYKPQMKIFNHKYQEQYNTQFQEKGKLIFIPPQRKTNMNKLQLFASKAQKSDKLKPGSKFFKLLSLKQYQSKNDQFGNQNQLGKEDDILGKSPRAFGLTTQGKMNSRLSWIEKEKLDQQNQDKHIVLQLDDWEGRTLLKKNQNIY